MLFSDADIPGSNLYISHTPVCVLFTYGYILC